MKAIILAAGRGSRLLTLTNDRPKCLVELNGKSLLDWQIEALRGAGVNDILVVRGYCKEQIVGDFETRENSRWHETSMVVTLMAAKDWLLSSECIVSYSDIVYPVEAVKRLMQKDSAKLSILYDSNWLELWQQRFEDPLSDAESFKIDAQGRLVGIGCKNVSTPEIQGQYMGLTRVGASLAPELVSFYRGLGAHELPDGRTLDNMYMTDFLQALIDHGHRLQAVPVDGGWLEVDSGEDLALYARLYATGALRALCDLDGTQ